MNEGTNKQERSGFLGRSEFPVLPELQPGAALTPLDPNLINPIIRAYNALVKSEGRGRSVDGQDTIKTLLTAGGFVVEIVPAPQAATLVGELPPQGGGGTTTSGVTYEGAWSSGGTYAEGAMVIHTKDGQSGLFIRISGSGGAGTEPFASGYTSHWTMIARYFTTLLTVRNSATEYYEVNAAAKTMTYVNGNTVATIDVGSSPKIRLNSSATLFAEITPTTVAFENAGTTHLRWNAISEVLQANFSDGGSITLDAADLGGQPMEIRNVGVVVGGALRVARFIATPDVAP
jgi:hypothetical protein